MANYKVILDEIKNAPIYLPNIGWKIEQLNAWLEGYNFAKLDIIRAIENLQKGDERA